MPDTALGVPRFEKLKAPLKLKTIPGRLTDEIRQEIASNQRDLDPIANLDEEACFTGVTRTDVLAVGGEHVLQIGPANLKGGPAKYPAMANTAAQKALRRLRTG